jgi:hypothetical protein
MTVTPAGRGPQILGIYSFFVALTTITLALRLYCRTYIQKAFGWDDYFAAFAWVSVPTSLLKASRSNVGCIGLLYHIRLMCYDRRSSRYRTTCFEHPTRRASYWAQGTSHSTGIRYGVCRTYELMMCSFGGFASLSTCFLICSSRPASVSCCSAFL